MDGSIIGLNYQSLQAVLAIHDVNNPLAVFNAVHLIEKGALAAINERLALERAKAVRPAPRS